MKKEKEVQKHKCVSCGKESGKDRVFGVCRACQDYIIKQNETNWANPMLIELQEKTDAFKKLQRNSIDAQNGEKLIKLLRKILC